MVKKFEYTITHYALYMTITVQKFGYAFLIKRKMHKRSLNLLGGVT